MARIRATIDFDVGLPLGDPKLDLIKGILGNEINNLLHKIVRPENLQRNLVLFATADFKVMPNRVLFTQNDPEEESP